MSLVTRGVARLADLPPAKTHDVSVDRDFAVPMPDGVVLRADRYFPTAEPSGLPLLLTRTPYGRKVEGLLGRIYAERGYQVVIVSCRGTFESEGEWSPFRNERADGHAVLDWVAQQPWFGGVVGLFGASYVGLTQWSVIDGLPDYVKAWAPTVTCSYFADLFYPGGSFALESTLTWYDGLAVQEKGTPTVLRHMVGQKKRVAAAAKILPLSDIDVALTGGPVPPYQQWLENPGVDNPWWAEINFGRNLKKAPPASFVAGWYDLFLRDQVRDFVALRTAGRDVRMAIGPWTHGAMGGAGKSMRNTLAWMDTHVAGHATADSTARVELLVMGADKWVEFPDWPPPATEQRWHLQAGGGLSTDVPAESAPDTYRYDPADPTPGIGGCSLLRPNAGRKDNKVRETRKDVLLYTSEPMTDELTVAGPVSMDLYVKSSLDHTDFFVRLCDVDEKGKSYSLCDGILRIGPEQKRTKDGGMRLKIELFPTANTFRKGHRIRLQVSSGAYPTYVRNLGSGEPLGQGTTLVVADQEVFHDPKRPSALILPVLAEAVRA
jgi:putative CocE/NonD family hydrolase